MHHPPPIQAQADQRPLHQPPALQPGDDVALFSPSSHGGSQPPELREQALSVLAGWGLRPRPVEPEARHLYLAGTDQTRAAQFETLYADPAVKALFATRGGYGAARMLPYLNRERLLALPPKHVVGMSDVVALFGWLNKELGLGTLHGPCLAAPSTHRSPFLEENLTALRERLFTPQAPLELPCRLLSQTPPASVRGRLVGGCLSVLAAGVGTPWALNTDGAILFLEDVDEQPYRIDRLLNQLRQAGHLEHVRAVVLGDWTRCDTARPGLLEDVLRDVFAGVTYPVAWGLPAGHGERNLSLPLGREFSLEPVGDKVAEGCLLKML